MTSNGSTVMHSEEEKQPGAQLDNVSPNQPEATASTAASKGPSRWSWTLRLIIMLVVAYLSVTYLVIPALWKRYEGHHPALAGIPRITHTRSNIPGDPLNVLLIGTEEAVKKAMLAANWYPADPLTLRSCLGIAEATVLRRSYDAAPVSNLYLWDRKQDLAFEQPAGSDPRKRHHVRFWRSEKVDQQGRPLWAGAATYDERVEISRTTGQFTHHIAADVDAERDHLLHDLEQVGDLLTTSLLEGFHLTRQGKNGGGDLWHTDGNVTVCYLR
jgi:hypothetical protein